MPISSGKDFVIPHYGFKRGFPIEVTSHGACMVAPPKNQIIQGETTIVCPVGTACCESSVEGMLLYPVDIGSVIAIYRVKPHATLLEYYIVIRIFSDSLTAFFIGYSLTEH